MTYNSQNQMSGHMFIKCNSLESCSYFGGKNRRDSFDGISLVELDTGIDAAPGEIRVSSSSNHSVDNSECGYVVSITINNGIGGEWSLPLL